MRLRVLTMSLLLLVSGCGKKQEIACIVGNQDVIVGGESGQELSPTQVFRKKQRHRARNPRSPSSRGRASLKCIERSFRRPGHGRPIRSVYFWSSRVVES